MTHVRFDGLIVLAVAITACNQHHPPVSRVALEDCMLSAAGAERVQARCGTVDVPNDWQAPGEAHIGLHVAVLVAEGGRRAADPVFFIPGGPGQSGTAAFTQVAQAFAMVRRHRDIIVVDPRGTGESSRLVCKEAIPDDLGSEAARGALSTCAVELGNRPKHVNTESMARDLDAVRDALGYTRIDIYAASYGTRVAFEMLRLFPSRVRAVILDGVTPPETVLGVDQIVSSERALRALWARCASDQLCADRYHVLKETFLAVKAKLPRTVSIREPRSGARRDVELTARLFEDTVRSALYQSEMVAILPKAVDAAASFDDFAELASLAELQRASFAEAVNPLVYYSVVCQEDIPFLRPAPKLEFFDSHIGELVDLCKLWPVQAANADIKKPVPSDVPALLISGENDPVTPPSSAEAAKKVLGNARSVVLAEQGHIGMFRGCMPRLIADFLDDAQHLDVSCIENAKALPLFTGASGP